MLKTAVQLGPADERSSRERVVSAAASVLVSALKPPWAGPLLGAVSDRLCEEPGAWRLYVCHVPYYLDLSGSLLP
jgi:hypothetical protein